MWEEEGHAARDYLASRGISEETARAFGLGWAPATWTSLADKFTKAGMIEWGLLAGLVSRRTKGEGYYDFFRSRLIIPIRAPEGRPIAFGARLLGAEEGPERREVDGLGLEHQALGHRHERGRQGRRREVHAEVLLVGEHRGAQRHLQGLARAQVLHLHVQVGDGQLALLRAREVHEPQRGVAERRAVHAHAGEILGGLLGGGLGGLVRGELVLHARHVARAVGQLHVVERQPAHLGVLHLEVLALGRQRGPERHAHPQPLHLHERRGLALARAHHHVLHLDAHRRQQPRGQVSDLHRPAQLLGIHGRLGPGLLQQEGIQPPQGHGSHHHEPQDDAAHDIGPALLLRLLCGHHSVPPPGGSSLSPRPRPPHVPPARLTETEAETFHSGNREREALARLAGWEGARAVQGFPRPGARPTLHVGVSGAGFQVGGSVMADKRKTATRKSGEQRLAGTKTRRAPAAAGRIARPREVPVPREVLLDEHALRVRDEIDAALDEAQRMREDITQRIESELVARAPVSRAPVSRAPVATGRPVLGADRSRLPRRSGR